MSEKRLIHDSSLDIRLGKCEKDNLNNLWISNGTGLVHYIDVRTRAVRIFRLMSDEKVKLIGDERYHIIQDVPRGLIWISTYGNGLFVYDSQKEEMTHYSYHVDEFNRVNSHHQPDAHTIYRLYIIHSHGFPSILALCHPL